ncbi:MAG: tetratricopeptide repeat protein, partial [Spirulina sp. SIO3F2]|nr:tetratricopeptide repeat protein [Spirulina sp. SIO3F2]
MAPSSLKLNTITSTAIAGWIPMTQISSRILEVQAEDYQSCFAQANQLYDQGHYTEALAYYQRALQYQPDDYWGWYRHGSVLEDLGDYTTALQSYQKAVQARPDDYW